MADDTYPAPGSKLCEKLSNAEQALGRVMSRPGRTGAELHDARMAVNKAERALRTFSDGRAYEHD